MAVKVYLQRSFTLLPPLSKLYASFQRRLRCLKQNLQTWSLIPKLAKVLKVCTLSTLKGLKLSLAKVVQECKEKIENLISGTRIKLVLPKGSCMAGVSSGIKEILYKYLIVPGCIVVVGNM